MGWVGFDEFCQFGIGGLPTIAFGNVTGGGIDPENQDWTHNDGIAGQDDPIFGLMKPNANIETIYKGEALLSNCHRTTFDGLPPLVYILGGVIGVTLGAVSASGYIDKVTVSCGGIGEAAKVVYDFVALAVARVTVTAGQVLAAAVTAPYRWERGAVTINAAAHGAQSFETALENNLRQESSLDAASSPLRQPEIVEPGNEMVTMRAAVKLPMNLDLGADVPTLPYDASFAIGNGFTTKTITNRGIYQKGEPIKFEAGDGGVIYDIEGETKHNSLRSAATAAWAVA